MLAALALATVALGPGVGTPAAADGNEAPGAPLAARSLAAGAQHTCALLPAGTVKCWGLNHVGQLGQGDTANRGDGPGEMGAALLTVDLGTGRTATALSTGRLSSCAIRDDQSLVCWGRLYPDISSVSIGDAPGEMGDALAPVLQDVTAVTAGDSHVCALRDDGTVWCAGHNANGKLGRGNQTHSLTMAPVDLGAGQTATAVTAGVNHTCALLATGAVKCWGQGNLGQLGLGANDNRGDAPGEMGDALPPVDLGTGRTALAVSAGGFATCALLDDHSVKCWGNNTAGVLGQGDTDHRGDGPGEMGDALLPVALGTGRTARTISLGSDHACALLDDNTVRCWGSNVDGQLGLGDTERRGDGPGEMGDALLPVDLGTGRTAVAVTTGYDHTCAFLDDGTARCWGRNAAGQLGLGDGTTRGDSGDPGHQMGDALPPVDVAGTGLVGTAEATTGGNLPGTLLVALNPADFSIAGGGQANHDGRFGVALPPGTYFLYAIEPTGSFAPGFLGSPTSLVVPADTITPADLALPPLRGDLDGTVSESGSGTPLEGMVVLAQSAATGAPVGVDTTDASGRYAITGLRPGEHRLSIYDPSGGHAATVTPGTTTVTAGATSTTDQALTAQAALPAGAGLNGHVTEDGTGAALPGRLVVALRSDDFQFARGATTNASGGYGLYVPPGDYRLAVVDPTGTHVAEWHHDVAISAVGDATPVTAPSVTNVALAPAVGDLSGAVRRGTGAGVPGAFVAAVGPTGVAAATVTAADGTYSISGLTPGTYRVAVVDPDRKLLEYVVDAPDFVGASVVAVVAGGDTPVDAVVG
ncbi:MAG: carboxypeptidase regulatory-like domain-containing protein [Microthrixaceae bacterium]|nr:carboxypeptidase regulatory-like domain-containing protein [Microthrixaceae bacterium]